MNKHVVVGKPAHRSKTLWTAGVTFALAIVSYVVPELKEVLEQNTSMILALIPGSIAAMRLESKSGPITREETIFRAES